MRFLIKLEKYKILKEFVKNIDGFQQNVKSKSAICTIELQKKKKKVKQGIRFIHSQIPLF